MELKQPRNSSRVLKLTITIDTSGRIYSETTTVRNVEIYLLKQTNLSLQLPMIAAMNMDSTIRVLANCCRLSHAVRPLCASRLS